MFAQFGSYLRKNWSNLYENCSINVTMDNEVPSKFWKSSWSGLRCPGLWTPDMDCGSGPDLRWRRSVLCSAVVCYIIFCCSNAVQLWGRWVCSVLMAVQRRTRGWWYCCCVLLCRWFHSGGTYHITTNIQTMSSTLAGHPSLEQWLLVGEHLIQHAPRVGPGHSPLSIYFRIFCSFLLFLFFYWLYLFSSFVHPFLFYQNSPTPFPGRRS